MCVCMYVFKQMLDCIKISKTFCLLTANYNEDVDDNDDDGDKDENKDGNGTGKEREER